MKLLVVLSAVAACALAKPGFVSPVAYNTLGYSPVAGVLGYGALPYAAAYHGVVAAAPAVSVVAPVGLRTQYHAQDELGQASYGHTEPLQAHAAVQDAAGNKIGSYSYVAPTGEVVRADYVADALGYRVASNALPVAPAPVHTAVADTAEVVAARAAHLAEVEAVKSRSKRGIAPVVAHAVAYSAPAVVAAPAVTYAAHVAAPAVAYAAPVAAPAVVAAAPAVRTATLTTVVNNPGHAVSYRVD
ncbi:cuticle protein 7-like [Schistocerca americana]|uniref:cuticle protein 7-like n=1 Tax=Schistocerca americana TaxID=7009 RepID=UPI001F4F771E|nr:cuticle protein 7-like [Schistocerca americana]